jgi:hypothetical protein
MTKRYLIKESTEDCLDVITQKSQIRRNVGKEVE